jgi:hypothetical protein
MSISVSRHASPRVLKITFVLTAILSQTLFAQQAAPVKEPAKAPALTISSKVLSSSVAHSKDDTAAQKKAELQYLHLPLSFEKNEGQADSRVKFLSRGAGYGLFLTNREAVLSFGGQKASSIKLRFLGADAKSAITAIDRFAGTSNYFLGNDRTKWHTNVPNFGKVEYKNLYSGIDLVYYGNQQKIEHDFVVAPQADASKIKFAIDGAKKVSLDKSGDLLVTTTSGELRLRKPAIYQTINGARQEIAGGYALKHGNEVSFVLGAYDRTRELTIDPVLVLSTYLADVAGVTVTGVAADNSGIYVTGYTQATSLRGVTPTLSNSGTGDDVFVAKLDGAGNQLVYSAFIGGSGTDRATGLAVNSQNAYVTGYTNSAGAGTAFPTSGTAFQTDLQGTATQAAFVLQLHNDGSALDYSSYYGPTDNTARANAIALNGGFIDLAGATDSAALPTAGTPFQDGTTHIASTQSGFFAQFDPAQTGAASLPYASYIAGSAGNVIANAIAVTGAMNVYVAGQFDDKLPQEGGTELTSSGANDGFVLQFDPTNATAANQLTKATQIGGTLDDTVAAITVNTGKVYVAGQTHSTGLATGTPFNNTLDSGAGADGFVARLDNAGVLNYFSYLGGTGTESASSIAFDGTNIYVGGTTDSLNDLGIVNVLQSTRNGSSDGFVAKVNPAGGGAADLLYLTYFGGSGDEQINAVALNGSGSAVIIAGTSTSTDLSTTASAFQPSVSTTNNSFVASLDANGNTIDLSFTGSVDKDPIVVRPSRHDSFTLTFHVSVSAGTAHSVQLNYPMPGGSATPKLQFGTLDGGSTSTPITTSQGKCSTGSNGVSCILGDVTSASGVTITVPATTTANTEAVTGTIANVIIVSAAESLTTPGNATTTITNHIVQDADLQPSFSTPLTGPLTGGQTGLGFTVRVTNNSSGVANDLTAGLAKISGSFAGTNSTITGLTATGCTVDDTAHTYTCTVDALAHGTFQDFAFSGGTAHVTSGIKDDLTLSATVAPTQTAGVDNYVDSNNGNNSTSTVIAVQPVTDLEPSFTSTPSGPLTDGQIGLGFTVRVTNNGAASANDLASGAAKVSGSFAGSNSNITGLSAVGCTVDDTAHTYTCTLSAIAHTASQDFAFTGGTAHVTGGISGSLTFTATVGPTLAASVDSYHDTNTANDTAAPVMVSVQPVTHLTAAFSATQASPVKEGDAVSYQVTVTNTGAASPANDLAATAAQLTGTLTGPGSSISITAITGCNSFSGTGTSSYTCVLPALAGAGGTAVIRIDGTAHVTAGITDTVMTTATPGPNADGYSDSPGASPAAPATLKVQPVAHLSAAFTTTQSSPVKEGDSVTYQVTITNAGAASPANDLAVGAAQISGSLSGVSSFVTITSVTGCSTPATISGTNNRDYTCVLQGMAGAGGATVVTINGTAHVTAKIKDLVSVTAIPAPTMSGGINNYFDNPGPTAAAPAALDVQPVTHLVATFTATQASPVKEGDPVSYQITVTNAGAATPTNDLASGAAQLSGSLTGSGSFITINSFTGCTSSSGVGTSSYTCVLPAMAGAGGTALVTIQGTAHVTAGIKDRVTVTASPAPNAGGYFDNPGPTAATPAMLDIQPVTDLQPSITVPAVAVNNGAVGTQFIVTVTNNGTGAVNNLAAGAATVSGTFTGANTGTAFAITAVSPGCTIVSPASYSCTTSALTFGSVQSFTITGTPAVTRGIQDTLTVTANIASTQSGGVNNYVDSVSTNDSTNASTQVRPVTDLAVSFVSPPANVTTGTSTTYAVRVTNNGTGATNNLAATATKVSGSFMGTNSSFTVDPTTLPTGCTAPTSSTFVCVLSASNFGTFQTFPISGTVALNTGHTSDTLTLSATVSPNNTNDYSDSNTANDFLAFGSNIKGLANLTLSFTNSPTPVLVGNNLTYTATVSNTLGSSDAAGVTVSLPLVAGENLVSATVSTSGGSCTGSGPVVCTMGNAGTLAAGTSSMATIVLNIASPLPDSGSGQPGYSATPIRQFIFSQTATVDIDTTQTINSNAGNKSQSVSTTVQAAAHLRLQTTVNANPILINSSGLAYNNQVYTTTVTNIAGRSDAKNVTITATPPSGSGVSFVSATVSGGGASSCTGPDSSGNVTCTLPALATGNTAIITMTVTPQRSATTPPVPLIDMISLTSKDVTDPTPNPADTTNSSTIPVHNTISGGTLPLQDASSMRLATLSFGTVNQTGVTRFDTSSLSGVVLDSRYPLAAQPGTSLLYNFHTTASISGPVTFCFTPVQNFLKPERVRVFLISGGGSADITSSITPPAPTRATGVTQVCGSTPFVSDVSLAVLEPKNNPPNLQFVFNASSAGKGVTGSFVDLNPSGSSDPDVNPCNGNATLCSDTSQLRFYFFFIPFSGSVSSTAANPVVTASLPTGTTSIVVAAVDQTVPVPSVVNTPDDLKNLPNATTGLTIGSFAASIDASGGTVNPTSQTILAGQSANFSFRPTTPTGAPLQGNAVLTFTCANGNTTPNLDSAGIKCAINPPTFDITSSSNAVLLVSTTGSTIGMAQPSSRPGAPIYAVWVAFVGMPFAGIVIISSSGARRRWLKILLGFGLLVLAIGSQVACGGGGSMAPSAKFSTPRGSYEIVVTGMQNGTALSKNSFTITVQ